MFGEGSVTARVMLIGEQPGDSEDLAGKPFVGPAGRLLDDALEAAGIPRDETYVTNAVKHFKYTQRGKRRIHDKPTRYEIEACRPWLGAELEVVKPDIVVVLDVTDDVAASRRAGVRLVNDARVRGLVRRPDGWAIETSAGDFTTSFEIPNSGSPPQLTIALSGATPAAGQPLYRIDAGGGIRTEFTSSYTMERPSVLPDFQDMYGQGAGGEPTVLAETDWLEGCGVAVDKHGFVLTGGAASSALATSSVVRPQISRRVIATRVACGSAGWQHVKMSRSWSSGIGAMSSSAAVRSADARASASNAASRARIRPSMRRSYFRAQRPTPGRSLSAG